MSGYIKLYRSITDSSISANPDYFSVWIHLLLLANYKENDVIFDDKKIIIKSGSFITSRAKIALNTGVQESKVERILKYLETEQQIEQQSFNKFRIISICNWDKYQQSEQQNEQPVNSQRTASEQPVNTNNKEKKDKKEKNNTIRDFILPENIKSETWDAYLEMRKFIKKPATLHAQKLIIGKLFKFKGDPNAILNQSITNSWQDVYELKTGGNNGAKTFSTFKGFNRGSSGTDRGLSPETEADADAINAAYRKNKAAEDGQ